MYSIIQELRSTSSNKEKIEILKKNSNNTDLKSVLALTYESYISYYVRDYNSAVMYNGTITLEDAMKSLDRLIDRELTGEDAKNYLTNLSYNLTPEDAQVLRLIINRDLACGISVSTINKAFPGLVSDSPYMRCSLLKNKGQNIVYPAMVQLKANGKFANVIIDNSAVTFTSRNGNPFELESLRKLFLSQPKRNIVFIGEITIVNDDGSIMDRKTGNGLLNKLEKKDQTLETLCTKIENASNLKTIDKLIKEQCKRLAEYDWIEKHARIELWDQIDLMTWKSSNKYRIPYDTRFKGVLSTVAYLRTGKVSYIKYEYVNSFEEAQKFYKECLRNKMEGSILKNLNSMWLNGTSTEMVKLKPVGEVDLVVVGYVPGEGAFEGGVGSLICQSSDGLLEVSVGTELSREERGFERVDPDDFRKGIQLIEGFDVNKYTGRIVSVSFNELCTSKGKEKASLYLPTLAEIRTDKTVADDFETITKIAANTASGEE